MCHFCWPVSEDLFPERQHTQRCERVPRRDDYGEHVRRPIVRPDGRVIATDNVMILFPRCPMPLTTKLFVALMLNQQAWRYSYGRQCYREKFIATELWLPVVADSEALDESYMRRVVENDEYWPLVAERLST